MRRWLAGALLAAAALPGTAGEAPKVYTLEDKPWGTLEVFVPPTYPKGPLAQGVEATIDVEGKLMPDGALQEIAYRSDAPDAAAFVREVELVAPYWRFSSPTSPDCKPLPPTPIKLKVHFEKGDGTGKIAVSHARYDIPAPPPGRGALKRVQPLFPKEGARAGIEGRVYAAAHVGTDGQIGAIDMEVATRQDLRPSFKRTTRAALEQWEFPPSEKAWIACMVLDYRLRR